MEETTYVKQFEMKNVVINGHSLKKNLLHMCNFISKIMFLYGDWNPIRDVPSTAVLYWNKKIGILKKVPDYGYPFGREEKKMKCTLGAIILKKFIFISKKNWIFTLNILSILWLFSKKLDMISILDELPNSIKINMVRFP